MTQPSRLNLRAARHARRGGFTLVELLVVIGIIAILAGVLSPAVIGGLKTAQQNAALQVAKNIGTSELQFSIDNSGSYPPLTAGDAGEVAKELINGGYTTDPKIFALSPGKAYALPDASGITAANVSWTFVGRSGTTGVTGLITADPDQLPLVYNAGNDPAFVPGANLSPGAGKFGTDGVAVCYKNSSAFFKKAKGTGAAKQIDTFIDNTFTVPTGVAYSAIAGTAP